jgi:hypothetical protein
MTLTVTTEIMLVQGSLTQCIEPPTTNYSNTSRDTKMKKNIRKTVWICNICRKEIGIADDLDTYGLALNGFYAGPDGGGPLPKDTFICDACVSSKITLKALIKTIFNDDDDEE